MPLGILAVIEGSLGADFGCPQCPSERGRSLRSSRRSPHCYQIYPAGSCEKIQFADLQLSPELQALLADPAFQLSLNGLVAFFWKSEIRAHGSGYSAALNFVRISSYFYPQLADWYAVS